MVSLVNIDETKVVLNGVMATKEEIHNTSYEHDDNRNNRNANLQIQREIAVVDERIERIVS